MTPKHQNIFSQKVRNSFFLSKMASFAPICFMLYVAFFPHLLTTKKEKKSLTFNTDINSDKQLSRKQTIKINP